MSSPTPWVRRSVRWRVSACVRLRRRRGRRAAELDVVADRLGGVELLPSSAAVVARSRRACRPRPRASHTRQAGALEHDRRPVGQRRDVGDGPLAGVELLAAHPRDVVGDRVASSLCAHPASTGAPAQARRTRWRWRCADLAPGRRAPELHAEVVAVDPERRREQPGATAGARRGDEAGSPLGEPGPAVREVVATARRSGRRGSCSSSPRAAASATSASSGAGQAAYGGAARRRSAAPRRGRRRSGRSERAACSTSTSSWRCGRARGSRTWAMGCVQRVARPDVEGRLGRRCGPRASARARRPSPSRRATSWPRGRRPSRSRSRCACSQPAALQGGDQPVQVAGPDQHVDVARAARRAGAGRGAARVP